MKKIKAIIAILSCENFILSTSKHEVRSSRQWIKRSINHNCKSKQHLKELNFISSYI